MIFLPEPELGGCGEDQEHEHVDEEGNDKSKNKEKEDEYDDEEEWDDSHDSDESASLVKFSPTQEHKNDKDDAASHLCLSEGVRGEKASYAHLLCS